MPLPGARTIDQLIADFTIQTSGYFKKNTTGDISSAYMRLFASYLFSSYPNILDNAFDGLKGLRPDIETQADLKAIEVDSEQVGITVSFMDTGSGNSFRPYTLVAGTDAESLPDVIRPVDYNASTNAKVWKLGVTGGGYAYTAQSVKHVSDTISLAGNAFPSTGGTGTAGAWKKHDRGYVPVGSGSTTLLVGGYPIPGGVFIEANKDNPSTSDPSDWWIYGTIN